LGNKRTKVEQMGLSRFIQGLAAEGLSARRIAVRVKVEKPEVKISDSAVIRYVGKLRSAAADEAFDVIRKHVDKVVPEDLKALEEMEAQCLEWAREAGKDRIDRMAEAAVEIRGKVDAWRLMLQEERDADGQRVLVKKIIRECLEFMAREDRLQAQRDKAMNTAIKIIDLKLRQAGLLDDEGKGRIVIVDRRTDTVEAEKEKKGYKPFVIQGGRNAERPDI
jgi:hypothetical protein